MSKYSEKKERQAKERLAAYETERIAASKPKPAPTPTPKPKPQTLDAHDRDLAAKAVRRIADAVAALAEAHAIAGALKKRTRGEEQAIAHQVFQVTGAAWTRSCGAMAKMCNLTTSSGGAREDAECPKAKGASATAQSVTQ